jgi:putative hemolysin
MAASRPSEVLSIKASSKRLPRPLLEAARRCFNLLLGFDKFNAVYARLPSCEAADLSRIFLDAMKVRVELDGEPREAIPPVGPLVVIANHPFGLIEGMVVDALLLSVRPDVTVMAVHLLAAIPEWHDRLIFVDPLRSKRKRKLNARGWRQAFRWLGRGGAMGVFPAGRVARFQWRRRAVADPPWSPHIAALARRTGALVLPVHFHGRNGWPFQLAAILCPPLKNLSLVREITNKRGWTLRATLGRLIQPSELAGLATDDEAIAFLRQETEKLGRPQLSARA